MSQISTYYCFLSFFFFLSFYEGWSSSVCFVIGDHGFERVLKYTRIHIVNTQETCINPEAVAWMRVVIHVFNYSFVCSFQLNFLFKYRTFLFIYFFFVSPFVEVFKCVRVVDVRSKSAMTVLSDRLRNRDDTKSLIPLRNLEFLCFSVVLVLLRKQCLYIFCRSNVTDSIQLTNNELLENPQLQTEELNRFCKSYKGQIFFMFSWEIIHKQVESRQKILSRVRSILHRELCGIFHSRIRYLAWPL